MKVFSLFLLVMLSFYSFFSISLYSKPLSDKKVIVIGAGISGLAAAKELQKQGYKVLVLEAKNKIGGRIDTQEFDGIDFEMGASWIHGDKKNPVATILKKEGSELVPTNFEDYIIYGDSPKNEQDLEGFFKFAYYQMERLNTDISIAESFKQYIQKYNIHGIEKDYLYYRLKIDIETEYGEDIENISLFSLTGGKEMKGGDKLVLGGYKRVIQYLSKDIDIRLNTIVIKVQQDSKGVKVYDNSKNIYSGNYAIVTVPLGILKKGTIKFEPLLSNEKLLAINSVRMGNLHKTYLIFEKPFWENIAIIGILDTNKENTSKWGEFFNLEKIIGKPILLTLHAGKNADEISKKTKEELQQEIFLELKKIYPNATYPQNIITSNWHKDPYSLGSYSYLPTGINRAMYKILAKKEGYIYFAGEHTHTDYPSTTHGAYLSGIRAAKEIIQ